MPFRRALPTFLSTFLSQPTPTLIRTLALPSACYPLQTSARSDGPAFAETLQGQGWGTLARWRHRGREGERWELQPSGGRLRDLLATASADP